VVSETGEEQKAARFERRYTAVLLLVVAILLLLSTLYTGRLWGVKAGIALGLLGMSGYFFWRARACLRSRF
jgi:hypothetical protein